jgi:asparagine synthase (glutamine-hydrolysing)
MCGFFGIIQKNVGNKIEIKKLSTITEHRGPNDWGWLTYNNSKINRGRDDIKVEGQVILSHQRLSIIDLSEAGWQPMVSECKRYSISYNGEVYNYLELKEELKCLGYTFISQTDTEVIINSWKEWGIDCVKRFKGMFAFSILDSESERIYIVRDFFGIKPAYYCKWSNGWGFGSSINALKALKGVSRKKNNQNVYEYLRFGISDRGKDTLYENIKQVLPGTLIEIDINSLEIVNEHKFWQLKPVIDTKISFGEAVKKTRNLFLQSVKLHMRSDVSLGAALSGGIDSSAIVCSIRHLYPEKEIHTFTFVSEDEKKSEEKWADIVNIQTNSISHKIKPKSKDLLLEIDDLCKAQEEPFGSTSIYAQYKVYENAKAAGIKVMLDGQGADELLGGYLYYQGARLATMLSKCQLYASWQFLNQSKVLNERNFWLLLKMTGPYLLPENLIPVIRKIIGKSVVPQWLNKDWMERNRIKSRTGSMNKIKGLGYLNSHLIDSTKQFANLLRYADRNSMYHSIESRVPFLLPDFAEFLLSLPENYLINDQGVTKYVFREAMRGIVPDPILDRHDKIGFEVSQNLWFSQLQEWIMNVLLSDKNTEAININIIQDELKKVVLSNSTRNSHHIWRTLCYINSFKED